MQRERGIAQSTEQTAHTHSVGANLKIPIIVMDKILKTTFNKYIPIINRWLDKLLPPEDAVPQTIHRAMRYSIFAGGKRLRPTMAIRAFHWVGGKSRMIFPASCALEMIHTYSLIHDDLPAMDNDDFRRGEPTCHKIFGEAIAILAGDALHALAFEILGKTKNPKLIGEVAEAIGTSGLVGGQVVDIEMEGKDIDEETVMFIHLNKTAALFITSVRLGAILGKASQKELEALTKYAQSIGLAFQITDDVLDIKGDRESLGKDIGSDLDLDKATYPRAVGVERSMKIAAELVENAKSSLLQKYDNKMFMALGDFILERTY